MSHANLDNVIAYEVVRGYHSSGYPNWCSTVVANDLEPISGVMSEKCMQERRALSISNYI